MEQSQSPEPQAGLWDFRGEAQPQHCTGVFIINCSVTRDCTLRKYTSKDSDVVIKASTQEIGISTKLRAPLGQE